MPKELTKKELSARWRVCMKTVERRVKRMGLVPSRFTGHQPLFDVQDVKVAEDIDYNDRLAKSYNRKDDQ